MITSKTYTIETRLNQRDNAEIIEYAKEYNVLYGRMLRFAWHRYNNGGTFNMKKSDFNTILQRTFGVSKRLANSVISEIEGLYKALYQLKWYEYGQLKGKISKKRKKVKKLSEKVYAIREKAKDNGFTQSSLWYYRKLKADIFYAHQKINRMEQKKKNLLKEIQSKDLHICFGSKKLFYAQFNLKENNLTNHKVWLERFRQARDNRSLYIGSKDESRCNQILQLTSMVNAGKGNSFTIQLCKNTKELRHVRGFCVFKYMDVLLTNSLIKQDHGVTYRIVFRGSKCYLQAMATLDKDTNDCKTRSSYGTIGLDYNDGFIELAETNETGNLVHLEHFDLKFHGTGDSATSEIREVASRIVNYALLTGKDIVIEDLDFRKAKSETDEAKSEDGKEYNKMIHAFDYSRYKKSFENCCFRRDVNLMEVNPAYTSKIAKQKYCDRKKLVIHQGASFVIARKGQGYVDKYIKPKKRKTKKSV